MNIPHWRSLLATNKQTYLNEHSVEWFVHEVHSCVIRIAQCFIQCFRIQKSLHVCLHYSCAAFYFKWIIKWIIDASGSEMDVDKNIWFGFLWFKFCHLKRKIFYLLRNHTYNYNNVLVCLMAIFGSLIFLKHTVGECKCCLQSTKVYFD